MTSTVQSKPRLFTIGHADHKIPHFLSLLARHRVTAIADVRSRPYSRFAPQFNREALAESLKAVDISYVFLGRELGARRSEPEAYCEGQAKYALVRQLPAYVEGLQRLRKGIASQKIALMCAEKDPLTCHRAILVCRSLRQVVETLHILDDGTLESGDNIDSRLLEMMGLSHLHLFRNRHELIEQAYELQGERIAYVEQSGLADRGEVVS